MNKEAKAIVDYLEEEREAIRTLCYYPDDVLNCEDLIMVMDYVNQLEANWNELKKYIRKTKIKEFEKAFGKRYGKTFTQAEIIVCNMLIEKMQELERGK